MIGSFWNLCRACPSMPVDKLHSEYRSTYRWHEYTGSRQDVVRRPPEPKAALPGENAPFPTEKIQTVRLNEEDGETEGSGHKMEPAMPRRKKHPELAYKTHEFITYDEDGSSDSIDASIRADRARSEERAGYHLRPSRRSRSEGPPRGPSMNNIAGSFREENMRRRDSDPDLEIMDSGGLLRKAISRISTEYRLQFAWPQGHNSRADAHQLKDGSLPKKSLSMSAIKPASQAMVHKKRNELDTKDVSELEPLVNDIVMNEENEKILPKNVHTDYKKKFRPFSQYDYLESEAKLAQKEKGEQERVLKNENGPNMVLYPKPNAGWYKEVAELRKKAGEYKHRGWGTDLIPEHISEMYNKQVEVWDQVSRRSSLSALSLASTVHRSYTKDEKEQENNKRNSPTKNLSASRVRDSVDNSHSARAIREMIRHHLERTTGGSELDGLILSPTREKLEPTVPKKTDDHSKSKESHSQKSSPKKDPSQKSSLNKKNTQKTNSKTIIRQIRSQSVGPVDVIEKRSPKRLSRSTTVKAHKSTRESASSPPASNITRRPRPSSLNTTASSRSKCNSVPLKNATSEDRLPKSKTNKTTKDNRTGTPVHVREKINKSTAEKQLSGDKTNGPTTNIGNAKDLTYSEASVGGPTLSESGGVSDDRDREPPLEHVVKSPPEPTRVKSPEQIMMRSPDPVNWTVPLDTGKTFTVTQNVREGELMNRPHSEVKAWTPPDAPPPAAQSAPPELAERDRAASATAAAAAATAAAGTTKAQVCKMTQNKNSLTSKSSLQDVNTSSSGSASQYPLTVTVSNVDTVNDAGQRGVGQAESVASGAAVTERSLSGCPGPELNVLNVDPAASAPLPAVVTSNPLLATSYLASEVLEKARNRFDMFWGKSKPQSEDDK